jgi:hypothetical protein
MTNVLMTNEGAFPLVIGHWSLVIHLQSMSDIQ